MFFCIPHVRNLNHSRWLISWLRMYSIIQTSGQAPSQKNWRSSTVTESLISLLAQAAPCQYLAAGRIGQRDVSDDTSVPSSQSYRSHDYIRRHWQCPVRKARPGFPFEKRCSEFVVFSSLGRRLLPGRQRSKAPFCDGKSFHIGFYCRKEPRKSSIETEGSVERLTDFKN